MIYRAGYVLPMTGAPPLENGEVMVRDGLIAAVGCGLAEKHPDEQVTDLGGCALLPGFVNAHAHLEPTFMRNRLDGLNLWDWLEGLGFRKDAAPSADLLRLSALLGAAECAMSGITCVGDSSFAGVAAEALDEVGLRGVAYLEVFGQTAGERYAERFDLRSDQAKELDQSTSDRISVGLSPHSVYTSDRNTLKLCAESDLPIALHAAETEAELDYLLRGNGPIAEMRRRMGCEPMVSGMAPIRYLGDVGLLRPGVCLAHCVHVTEDEIDMIAKSGATVAHCGRSNAYLGVGVAPVREMLGSGVVVGLGTDSAASCVRLDFFEEMRFALAMQRARAKDAGAMMAKNALELATAGGAAALGLLDRVGTLEPGKRADMVAVDTSAMLPGEDIWLIVLSRSPSDVVLSLVDGVEVVGGGGLSRVDIAETRARLVESTGSFG